MFAHPGAFGDVKFAVVRGDFALDHRHQAFAIEWNFRLDPCQFQNGRHQILVKIEARNSLSSRDKFRIANDQRYVQNGVVNPMMIEVAVVIVKGFAMIRVDHHDRIIQKIRGFPKP